MGEESAGFFGRVAFTASSLGKGVVEVGVDSFSIALQPVFVRRLRFDEGVAEQLSRLAEGAAVALVIVSLFHGGMQN